jgi:hypothetical protein
MTVPSHSLSIGYVIFHNLHSVVCNTTMQVIHAHHFPWCAYLGLSPHSCNKHIAEGATLAKLVIGSSALNHSYFS